MNQTTPNNQEWLKILGKGMITLPKKWRDELGITNGDIVTAKKEGNKVIIEPFKSLPVPYRVYSDSEINNFLAEDKLSEVLRKKLKNKFS